MMGVSVALHTYYQARISENDSFKKQLKQKLLQHRMDLQTQNAESASMALMRKSSLQDLEKKLRVFDKWDLKNWTGAKKPEPFRSRLETILEEEEKEKQQEHEER